MNNAYCARDPHKPLSTQRRLTSHYIMPASATFKSVAFLLVACGGSLGLDMTKPVIPMDHVQLLRCEIEGKIEKRGI